MGYFVFSVHFIGFHRDNVSSMIDSAVESYTRELLTALTGTHFLSNQMN